ncbi:MAG: CaiB/BaiF CoA-transferase family protein, partial [Chloroflexi bacterium]|nr:CaiB/BaiF CoA-transferase family protein [Chloroflexota bacterium]
HPERSLYFWHYHTSKRGITLDLEHEEARDVFRKLVATADILLDSMPPGHLDALGLSYDSLSEGHPGLIMCSLTPFGQDGPWRDYPTTDLIQLGAGGQMALCGYYEEDDPEQMPIAPGGGNAWHMGSHYAYIAIMAAVHYRKMKGKGQFIDVSVHEACALTTEMHMSTYIYTGKVAHRQTGQHANVNRQPARQLPTATPDRYLIAMANIQNRRQLEPIVQWMEREGKVGDLADEQYQDSAFIAAHSAEVAGKVKDFIGELSVDDAYHGSQAAGQPWGAVRAPEEVYEDQHFHERGFFPEVEHPELGEKIPYLGGASIYPKSPWRIYRRAPLIGEDNASVFAELGLTEQDVASLREVGAI